MNANELNLSQWISKLSEQYEPIVSSNGRLYSPKQCELGYLGWHTPWIVADGPTQCGKSWITNELTHNRTHYAYSGSSYAIIAPTQRQIDAVAGEDLDRWAFDKQLKIHRSTNHIRIPSALGGFNKLYTIPVNDARATGRLKSMRFVGILWEEWSEIPKISYLTGVTRRSQRKAWMIHNTNPKDELHWVKQIINARMEHPYSRRWWFQLMPVNDNPVPDPEYVQELIDTYEPGSTIYQNLLQGVWTKGGGLVFPLLRTYAIVDLEYKQPPEHYDWFLLSVDPAEQSYAAANLYGISGDSMWQVDEWSHDRELQGYKPSDELAQDIYNFTGTRIPAIIVSDYDSRLTEPLERLFNKKIAPAPKQDKQANCELTNAMIETSKLQIMPNCINTIRESGGYVLDERAQEQGRWAVVKGNDHHMDCMQYATRTFRRVRGMQNVYS